MRRAPAVVLACVFAFQALLVQPAGAQNAAGQKPITGGPDKAMEWRLLRWRDENGVFDPTSVTGSPIRKDAGYGGVRIDLRATRWLAGVELLGVLDGVLDGVPVEGVLVVEVVCSTIVNGPSRPGWQCGFRSWGPAFLQPGTQQVAAGYAIYGPTTMLVLTLGNGVQGFTTPLATTHAFNGWSDSFASAGGNKSNADGLKNLYASVVIRPRFRFAYWFNTELTATFHDFDAERTGADLGREWDLQLVAGITPRLTFLAKYADFKREPTVPTGTVLGPPDRSKLWISFEYRL